MIKKLFKCEKGSIFVELGMFLPLLLAIVFGYIAFTNTLRNDIILQVSAREGAREYATTHSVNVAKEAAKQQLQLGSIDVNSVVIETKEKINSYGETERIVVVKKPMKFHIPFVGDYDISLQRGSMFYAEKED